MTAILKRRQGRTYQLAKSLVYQIGRLQGVAVAFCPQQGRRQSSQVGVDEGDQLFLGSSVAICPVAKQAGHVLILARSIHFESLLQGADPGASSIRSELDEAL